MCGKSVHNLFIMIGMIFYRMLKKGSASMSLIDNLTKEEILETPMIDIMYHYLNDERKPVDFYTLMDKIAEYKGWSNHEKKARLVQAYTDMNIDGRFVALGDNKWGLKSWYPVEQTEEELATTIKPKKRKKVAEDDFDDYDEIVELEIDEDEISALEEDEEELDLEDEIDELDVDKIAEDDEDFIEEDDELNILEEGE